MKKKQTFEIMDVTLRDGSYAINFQFSTNDEKHICTSLERLGLKYIEMGSPTRPRLFPGG